MGSHGDGEEWSISKCSRKAEPTGFADGLDAGSKNIEKSRVIPRILAQATEMGKAAGGMSLRSSMGWGIETKDSTLGMLALECLSDNPVGLTDEDREEGAAQI